MKPVDLPTLLRALREGGFPISIDDAARIARVLIITDTLDPARRLGAVASLVAKSPNERARFAALVVRWQTAGKDVAPIPLPDPHVHSHVRRRMVLACALVSIGLVAIVAVVRLSMCDRARGTIDAAIDASIDAGVGADNIDAPNVPQLNAQHVAWLETSDLPSELRGLAGGLAGFGLVLVTLGMLLDRARIFGRSEVERLARSTGRRVPVLPTMALEPIAAETCARLCDLLAIAPSPVERVAVEATIIATAQAGGRFTLCFDRDHNDRIAVVEDLSPGMDRYPGHTAQVLRALRAAEQRVDHYTMVGSLDRLRQVGVEDRPPVSLAHLDPARVVIISDGSAWDPVETCTREVARLVDSAIWLNPRPAELWSPGARWLAEAATMIALTDRVAHLEATRAVVQRWRPPSPRDTAEETVESWRAALGDPAFFAFACTALLDLAHAWTATTVCAALSNGVVRAPRAMFDRVWELADVRVRLGRIDVAPEVRDQMLFVARTERSDELRRVGSWLSASIDEGAEPESLAKVIAAVYLDRIARATGTDTSGVRVRELARRGLRKVAAEHVDHAERDAWRLHDPRARPLERTRRAVAAISILGALGTFGLSIILPGEIQHQQTRMVPWDSSDLGNDAVDGPTDVPADVSPDTVDPEEKAEKTQIQLVQGRGAPGDKVTIRARNVLPKDTIRVLLAGKDLAVAQSRGLDAIDGTFVVPPVAVGTVDLDVSVGGDKSHFTFQVLPLDASAAVLAKRLDHVRVQPAESVLIGTGLKKHKVAITLNGLSIQPHMVGDALMITVPNDVRRGPAKATINVDGVAAVFTLEVSEEVPIDAGPEQPIHDAGTDAAQDGVHDTAWSPVTPDSSTVIVGGTLLLHGSRLRVGARYQIWWKNRLIATIAPSSPGELSLVIPDWLFGPVVLNINEEKSVGAATFAVKVVGSPINCDKPFDSDVIIGQPSAVAFPNNVRCVAHHGIRWSLRVDHITVDGSATIDGTGDQGVAGADAKPLVVTVTSRSDFDAAKANCAKTAIAGQRGGDGGRGATVELLGEIVNRKGLVILVDGGRGGPGGRGVGAHVRLMSAANTTLPQTPNPKEIESFDCPPGPDGAPGKNGPRGDITN